MGDNEKKEKEFLDGLVKDQPVTRAMQKLTREPLAISVYRHTPKIEAMESELAIVDSALANVKDESDKVKIEERKKQLEAELKTLENDKIEGILTPLTYRDVNDIKAAVTEAIIHFQEYKFDPEVVMSRVVAEERFMTVFCALKSKDNRNVRYFSSLDDIAMMDEMTIFDLYNKWEQHFVLTDTELKN